MTTNNMIPCYDPYVPVKRAAVALSLLAMMGTGLVLQAPPAVVVSDATVVHQLPTVVVEGKSISTLARERAQLQLAQSEAETRAN